MIEEGLAELAALKQPGSNRVQVPSSYQAQQDLEGATAEATAANNAKIESLETEIANLKQMVSVNETARQATTEEAGTLRSHIAKLQDYIIELHQKQEDARLDKVLRQARKEERETRRREAWFEAERKGRKGDRVLREMEVEDSVVTSDTDDLSSDEN